MLIIGDYFGREQLTLKNIYLRNFLYNNVKIDL